MSKQVWKYVLNAADAPLCTVEMPEDSEVISAREQGEDVCVWALVDPDSENEMKKFVVVGTGHEIPQFGKREMRFVGTAHLQRGALVFHVFELMD